MLKLYAAKTKPVWHRLLVTAHPCQLLRNEENLFLCVVVALVMLAIQSRRNGAIVIAPLSFV